jgi:hypothetical protein
LANLLILAGERLERALAYDAYREKESARGARIEAVLSREADITRSGARQSIGNFAVGNAQKIFFWWGSYTTCSRTGSDSELIKVNGSRS